MKWLHGGVRGFMNDCGSINLLELWHCDEFFV